MQVKILIVFAVIILIVVLAMLVGKLLIGTNEYFSEIELANDFSIKSEWANVDFRGPLLSVRDHDFIALTVKMPYKIDLAHRGITAPTGEIFNPEVVLVDSKGSEYPLVYFSSRSFHGINSINYGSKEGLPHDRHFEKVLLRSDTPLPNTNVFWTGYNVKDLP